MSTRLDSAARVRPPTSTATDLALVAGAASVATATGTVADSDGHVITVACGVAFNIRFGLSTVSDPADTSSFPAGVYSFEVNGKQTHFKITGAANGYATYWRSSFT